MKRNLGILVLAIATLVALPLVAQEAISAKAGLVNYFEGTVLLNGEELAYNITKFHQVPSGGVLETPANGRAEVLLSPGVMLWLGESSRLQLVSDRIDAAEVRLLAGTAVISSTEFPSDTSVTVLVNEEQVRLNKAGVYNLSFYPARVEVHQGQAEVLRAGVETRVKKGRALFLDQPGSGLESLDKNATPDPLSLWAQTRDNYLQMANVSAARQVQTAGGFPSMGNLGMLGAYSGFGSWFYNPYFGMYTFVPFGTGFASPFGGYFWGPRSVMGAYAPFFGGGGFGGGGFVGGGSGRGVVGRNSVSRSGFSNNAAYGASTYSRGGSSSGDVFATSPRGRGGFGGGMDGFSRGSSAGSSGGYSRGGGGYSGGGASSAPSSAGGASMGRGGGGASSGGGARGGGGGRGN